MKDNQKNGPHEQHRKRIQQPVANPKNQLPPTDKSPSDTPLKEPTADENAGKEKSKENKGFTSNQDNNKNKRPVAGDDTSRRL